MTDGARARLGLAQISLTALLWGSAGVTVQLLHRRVDLGAISISGYRLAVAALVLLPFVARTPGRLRTALRANPVTLLLTGAGLAGYQALYFLAVAQVGVSIATVISLGVAPVLTAGWDAARARQWPVPRALAILAAGVVGLLLICLGAGATSAAVPDPGLGVLAAIGSGVTYAATTVLGRHVSGRVAPLTMTFVSAAVGAALLAPFALLDGVSVPPTPAVLGLLGYLGVVTTALAYALFYAGLRTTAGSTAAVLTLIEPLAAAVLAVLILGESLTGWTLAGGLLLLGSVAALYLRPA